ncbi:hypothetical protein [Halopseudomonas sabulinigri]|uniref:Uncharacterized protein n=1 Tax=Halopseudomonas sabulinigri TaxID=472181 RepID=A0ABP9ZLR1_9GAMM
MTGFVLADITDEQIRAMASQIQTNGFVCLPGLFTPEEVNEAQAQALAMTEEANWEYTGREGSDAFSGAILEELTSREEFSQLCHRLCRHQGIELRDPSTKQVLRCLTGNSGLKHCFYFHYDSFELTALVPILIPSEEPSGDLFMFPNARARRRSYLVNMIEKFLLDRRGAQARIKKRALSHTLRLKLQPGNIYFFNGNRTLHANGEIDPRFIRATMVVHFAETYHDHWIRKLRRGVSNLKT